MFYRYLLSVLLIALTPLSLWGGSDEKEPDRNSVKVNIAAGNYYLKSAQRQKAYIQIELTAPELVPPSSRQPLNLAIVVDRSTLNTKESPDSVIDSVLNIVNQLEKNDTLSILTYGNSVNTIFPAARITDYQTVKNIIRSITPDNGSILFAAVSKAAYEVQKFNKPDVVSRIIIISKNAITIGPDTPEILGDLGISLLKDNITVSTIGIGNRFNDLGLAKLSINSNGHFYYIENNSQLPEILSKDISNALTVTAKNINISVAFSESVRSARSLKHAGEMKGNTTNFTIKELYANQPYSILMELDVAAGQSTKVIELATIETLSNNILTNKFEKNTKTIKAIYTTNDSIINNNINNKVMATVSKHLAFSKYTNALELREKGNIAQAVVLSREANLLFEDSHYEHQDKTIDLINNLSKMPEIFQNNNLYYNGGRKLLLSIIYSDY